MKNKNINVELLEALVRLLENSIKEAENEADKYSSTPDSKYPYQVGYLEGTIKIATQSLKELIK